MFEQKKKKSKKKSKKQIQREKEAAAEAARIEEIEHLKKLEIEEYKRREQLKQKELDDRKARADEIERLLWEKDQDASLIQERKSCIDTIIETRQHSKDWQQWILCNTLPNGYNEADLNVFLSIWGGKLESNSDEMPIDYSTSFRSDALSLWNFEDIEMNDFNEYSNNIMEEHRKFLSIEQQYNIVHPNQMIKNLLNGCEQAEQVIENIKYLMANAAETVDPNKWNWGNKFIKNIRDITYYRIDLITAKILELHMQHCDDNGENKENYDLVVSSNTPHISLGLWAHSSYIHTRRRFIEFSNLNATIELPKASAMLKVPMCLRLIQTSFDNSSICREKQSYVSVGGTITLQQLVQPSVPTKMGNWTVREISDINMSVIIQPHKPLNSINANQPQFFRISYNLPSHIFLGLIESKDSDFTHNKSVSKMSMLEPIMLKDDHYKIKVGWWNDDDKLWCTDGILDAIFIATTRQVIIDTLILSTFSIIQPRALDFPYRSWSLEMIGDNKGKFILQGARFLIEIGIQNDKCHLITPDAPELRHLVNNLNEPGLLFMSLANCGINIMPTDFDAIFTKKTIKDQFIENKCNKELASVAGIVDFRGSRWNGLSNNDCIVETRCKNDDKWLSVCVDKEKVYLVDLDSQSHKYSKTLLTNHESHNSMRRTIIAYMQEEYYQNEANVSLEFQMTVERLLNLARVFTFH